MALVIENSGTSTRPSNKTTANRDLVGIAFPFRKEKGEFPRKATNVDAVKSDIISLFNTPIRSRVMRRSFGNNAMELVFESTGPLLNARLQRNIRQTIANNEPRVVVIAIGITESNTQVVSTIVYSVQGVIDNVKLSFERPDVFNV